MLVVGLCGYAGAGKSTVAQHLVHNHCFVLHPFAGPLKAMIRCLGLADEHINGKLKETPCEMLGGLPPRHAMQTLGTEWGREMIHPDLWVKAWSATLPSNSVPGIVADDVRFENEMLAIRRMGGLVIEVARPGVTGGTHASEVIDFQTDRVILNSGTITDLQERIDSALRLEGHYAPL